MKVDIFLYVSIVCIAIQGLAGPFSPALGIGSMLINPVRSWKLMFEFEIADTIGVRLFHGFLHGFGPMKRGPIWFT